jgi:SAM-dependent methyltransferase
MGGPDQAIPGKEARCMSERWTNEKLMALSGAFLRPRILISAAELDLFSLLAKGPRAVEELCTETGWDRRGLTVLMDALAAIDLISKTEDGRYGVDESTAALLSRDGERSILPMILHRGRMWESWTCLTDIVKSGFKCSPIAFTEKSDEDMETFIGAMHVVGRAMAEKIAARIDLKGFNRMLDVGGGSGVYAMAILRKAENLRATVFDLPQVVEIAARRLAQDGFIDRVDLVAGDYMTDDLPDGHDLHLLSAVIHIQSREGNRKLYQKTYRSLLPGGTLLIRDYFMDSSRTVPVEGAIFAVNMLAATEGGNTYTVDEVGQDLVDAGFEDVEMLVDGGERMDQVIAARKPV